MKICLINPPSPDLIEPMAFPPLGLLYIAAVIQDYEPILYDAAIGDKIPSNCDVYGFTCTTPQAGWVASKITEIKAENPEAYIIVGGPHSTVTRDSLGGDCCVVGEGERLIRLFVDRIIPKIKFNGVVSDSSLLPIDEIPFPLRCKEFLDRYSYYLKGKRTTSMVTSRGCPFNCAYCCNRVPKFRLRKPEYVAEEVKAIKSKGYDSIVFYDDIFTIKKERVKRICELIRPLEVQWKCLSRGDLIDEEMVGWMAEAGCIEISFGVESGSQRILENVNRHVKTQDSIKAIKICNDRGISTRAFFIVGLPGESWESIEQTRQFLLKAQPTTFNVSVFTPYPGADIFANKEKYEIEFDRDFILRESKNLWYQRRYEDYQCFISTPYMSSKEILQARRQLSEEFGEEEKYWERKNK